MNGISTLTQKGQVAIPKAIRDYFDLKPFDKISFEIQGNKIIANPISPLMQMRGIARFNKIYNKKAEKKVVKDAILKKFKKKNQSA